MKRRPRLETYVVNLDASQLRVEYLGGEKHLVAPAVLMTPDVHDGSKGPLLYRKKELRDYSPSWNHKPIVLNHPRKGIACTPNYLNANQMGVVLHTEFERGKQRTEMWFNERRTATVSPRTLQALRRRQMMELSTGLFVDEKGGPGRYNGTRYKAIAANHKPDHVAILPDGEGACSIKDGGGVFQLNRKRKHRLRTMIRKQVKNTEVSYKGLADAKQAADVTSKSALRCTSLAYQAEQEDGSDAMAKHKAAAKLHVKASRLNAEIGENERAGMHEDRAYEHTVAAKSLQQLKQMGLNRDFTTGMRKSMAEKGAALPDGSFPIANKKDIENAIESIGRAKNPAAAKRHIMKRARALGCSDLIPDKWKGSTNNSRKELPVKKKDYVTKLIKNERSGFDEKDRKFLMGLEPAMLKKLMPKKAAHDFESDEELKEVLNEKVEDRLAELARNRKKKKKAEERRLAENGKAKNTADDSDDEDDDESEEDTATKTKGNKGKKKPTKNAARKSLKHFLENEVPDELRPILNQALRAAATEEDRLIKLIVNSKGSKFKEEDLKKLAPRLGSSYLDHLRGLAAMAKNAAADDDDDGTVASYFGAAAPVSNESDDEDDEELPLPTYNHSRFGEDLKLARVPDDDNDEMDDEDDRE